jgi:methionine synthase I (cobalamin-dependent)
MLELHRTFGVKVLGGCCGTDAEHLRYLARGIKS